MLEEIRLLTNLETSTEKLLQIVLAGQPELDKKLNQPELRQLRQRITLRARTCPLTLEDTRGYILERLRIAGANGQEIFSPEAIQVVHQFARGIPRVTNLLCEHALINAFVDQRGRYLPRSSNKWYAISTCTKSIRWQKRCHPKRPSPADTDNKQPLVDSLLLALNTLATRLHQVETAQGKTEEKPAKEHKT